ncbi:MAG: HepT-like ribonuclease domain-containing protein [Candidatus Latescibacterota bacterium]
MFDKELAREILTQIHNAAQTILRRFEPIESVEDFTNSPGGMEKLDALCMQLIAIGESIKNIDKITDASLLCQYTEIDWNGAKGLRDIVSHHYFDIDVEVIFSVCRDKIAPLVRTIERMLRDLGE